MRGWVGDEISKGFKMKKSFYLQNEAKKNGIKKIRFFY